MQNAEKWTKQKTVAGEAADLSWSMNQSRSLRQESSGKSKELIEFNWSCEYSHWIVKES